MDLHAWITQQVDRAEAAARKAADCATAHRWEAVGSLIVAVPDENTAGPDIIESTFHTYDDALVHAALHDPAAALRRCEADRRILARHMTDPDEADNPMYATACKGCERWGEFDYPNTDNLNDCPELLDLAHAHGLTDEILARLDRPQSPEPKPRIHNKRSLADVLGIATPPIATSDVPAALRGPHWKP